MSTSDLDDDKPLPPEQQKIVARVRWLMLISGFATMLGMAVVIGIGRGDAREHVLVALARQQLAVGQGGLAKHRQARVARRVGNNTAAASNLNNIKHLRSPLSFCPQQWVSHSVEDSYI